MAPCYSWRDSFICVQTTRSCVCHDSCTYVPWLVHTCAVTHAHVCRDSCTLVPWLMHTCAVTHAHVCRDSGTRVSWLHPTSNNLNLTPSTLCTQHKPPCYVQRDSFIYVPWLIPNPNSNNLMHPTYTTLLHATWLIHTCTMTHSQPQLQQHQPQ